MNSPETAPEIAKRHGLTDMPQPTVYEWIKPEHLPPVGCPLVICVDGVVLRAERISHLQSRGGQMDYRLSTGEVIRGRFEWSYP